MGGENSKDAKKEQSTSSNSPENLSDFWSKSKYSQEEIQVWYRKFTSTRPHKFITSEEFIETYLNYFPKGNATVFAENVFRLFDTNKDGRIDFGELAIALGVIFRGTQEERLQWMFSLYDKNGDGFIKRGEIRSILTSLVRMAHPDMFRDDVATIVEENIEKIYKELDQNQDGLLSWEEFRLMGNTSIIFMDAFQHGVSKLPK